MAKGPRFIDLVHAAGLTLDSLGTKVGLDRSALCNIGKGRRGLRLDRALAICRALHVDPSTLERSLGR